MKDRKVEQTCTPTADHALKKTVKQCVTVIEFLNWSKVMTPNLDNILDAARKLPISQQRELISRLQISSTREKVPGLVERHFGTLDSGDPDSANNEKIDADLAREYGDNHDFEN